MKRPENKCERQKNGAITKTTTRLSLTSRRTGGGEKQKKLEKNRPQFSLVRISMRHHGYFERIFVWNEK